MADIHTPQVVAERPWLLWTSLIALTAIAAWLLGRLIAVTLDVILRRLLSGEAEVFYSRVIQPQQGLLGNVITIGILDTAILLLLRLGLQVRWYWRLETPLTLVFTLALGWLFSRCFKVYFDTYLLDATLKSGRKTNSELLILGKFLANFAIVVILAITFGQTHDINVIGLVASLGVGGIAVAFAAQKVLEQLLGGIVIYVDRPFGVDDYIGLPDGTFGRVEAIGLRSTKVRTSGKGTLAIVPNNAVIQTTVENFTGAKKLMAIVHLNIYRSISEEERALIRQVIIESTRDIFGIDSRNTDIAFRDLESGQTQVQVTFFILGSGDVSMELRRQVLDVASQNLTGQLKTYGISFDIEEPTIYVDSPITI